MQEGGNLLSLVTAHLLPTLIPQVNTKESTGGGVDTFGLSTHRNLCLEQNVHTLHASLTFPIDHNSQMKLRAF